GDDDLPPPHRGAAGGALFTNMNDIVMQLLQHNNQLRQAAQPATPRQPPEPQPLPLQPLPGLFGNLFAAAAPTAAPPPSNAAPVNPFRVAAPNLFSFSFGGPVVGGAAAAAAADGAPPLPPPPPPQSANGGAPHPAQQLLNTLFGQTMFGTPVTMNTFGNPGD